MAAAHFALILRVSQKWERRPVYTEQQKAFLAKHWDAGYSAGQTAKAFNAAFGVSKSRNAISGWLYRNRDRLARPPQSPSPSGQQARGLAKVSRPQPRRAAPTLRVIAPPPVSRSVEKSFPADNSAQGFGVITILNASPKQCRWPISGTGLSLQFCGAPVDPLARTSARRPYCAAHGGRAALKSLKNKGVHNG